MHCFTFYTVFHTKLSIFAYADFSGTYLPCKTKDRCITHMYTRAYVRKINDYLTASFGREKRCRNGRKIIRRSKGRQCRIIGI